MALGETADLLAALAEGAVGRPCHPGATRQSGRGHWLVHWGNNPGTLLRSGEETAVCGAVLLGRDPRRPVSLVESHRGRVAPDLPATRSDPEKLRHWRSHAHP